MLANEIALCHKDIIIHSFKKIKIADSAQPWTTLNSLQTLFIVVCCMKCYCKLCKGSFRKIVKRGQKLTVKKFGGGITSLFPTPHTVFTGWGGWGGGASLVFFPHLTQCSQVGGGGGGGASLVFFPHLTQCSQVGGGGGGGHH